MARRPSGKDRAIRRHLLTLAASIAAFVLAYPHPADGRSGCQTVRCVERVAAKQCSQTRVIPCIRRAAIRYRQPFADMLRVARCESGLNPYAVGFRVHHGIYQYLTSTWRSTPYGHRDIYSAKWQALATGWMWSRHRRSEWACQ